MIPQARPSAFISTGKRCPRVRATPSRRCFCARPHIARHTPVLETPRAPYCLMGVCFDCLATVDGETSVQTCLLEARPGMRIERPTGKLRVSP